MMNHRVVCWLLGYEQGFARRPGRPEHLDQRRVRRRENRDGEAFAWSLGLCCWVGGGWAGERPHSAYGGVHGGPRELWKCRHGKLLNCVVSHLWIRV